MSATMTSLTKEREKLAQGRVALFLVLMTLEGFSNVVKMLCFSSESQ